MGWDVTLRCLRLTFLHFGLNLTPNFFGIYWLENVITLNMRFRFWLMSFEISILVVLFLVAFGPTIGVTLLCMIWLPMLEDFIFQLCGSKTTLIGGLTHLFDSFWSLLLLFVIFRNWFKQLINNIPKYWESLPFVLECNEFVIWHFDWLT